MLAMLNADATHRAPDINPGINPTNTKNRELAGARQWRHRQAYDMYVHL